MKVKRIEVRVGDRLSLQDFESTEPVIILTAELEEGDDLQASYRELRTEAAKMWQQEACLRLKATLARRTAWNVSNARQYDVETPAFMLKQIVSNPQ